MTREEFILQRLRDDCAQYRVLCAVCIAATVGAIALGVAMLLGHAIAEGFAVFAMGAGMASSAAVFRAQGRSLGDALSEVEEDPEGLAFPEDYSVRTATVIEKLLLPAKTYRSQAIAYGVSALSMLAGGIVIIAVCIEEPPLATLGGLLFTGGVLVGILAYQALRNWRAASQLG